MKTFFSQQLFLCGAALTMAMLGDSQSQAQSAGGGWTNRYNGPASDSDHATAIAVDASGNVFVTGQSTGSGSSMDYATIAYSGAGVAFWTNRYNGPVNRFDSASAVAVDATGNVFVTGYSSSSNAFYDNYAFATIKYSGAGVPLWTNRYGGPGNAENHAKAVAIDSSGDAVVTGDSTSNVWPYNSAYVTVKYSSAGVPLWTNRYSVPGNTENRANAVAVDSSGNVFVTGYGSGADYLTLAYSKAGVPLWTNRYDGGGQVYDEAMAIVVDGGGNVIVTGDSQGVGTSYDYATIKYSGSGVPLWTNRYNGPANSADYAAAVAVDGSGNVFVTGDSLGSGSIADYATVAYSSAGVPLWTNRYNSPVRNDAGACAVAVDGNGNVFVTGDAPGSGGYADYATIKYSGAGVPLWTNRYNGPANDTDYAAAMAVDASGNVVVTGSSYGPDANYDYVTIRYSSAATPLAPVFTSIAPNMFGTQALLTYTSDPGASFYLLSSTNLTTWQTNTTVNATGVTNSLSVNMTQHYEFYRLQRLP